MVSVAVVISLSLERGSNEAVLIGCIVMTGFGGIIQTYFWIYAYSVWEAIEVDSMRSSNTSKLMTHASMKIRSANKKNCVYVLAL